MSTDLEYQVATSFAHDVAHHRMIVKLDQGLHRHLVFQQRRQSWNCHFELITAPGSLTITGDHGSYVFRRMADMFQFFRSGGSPYGINASYWAEKLPDAGRSVKVYSEHALEQHLKERLADLAEEYRQELAEWRLDAAGHGEDNAGDKPELPEVLRRARELVRDYRADGELMYQEGADALLRDLYRAGAVDDASDWDTKDWDFHFLWCLHAIAWGVRQYDAAVKSGLHIVRTGPLAWDTPLPTTAPAAPKRPAPRKATPVVVTVQMAAGGPL